MTSLINVEKINPLEVFTEKGVDPLLKRIQEEVKGFEPDVLTIKGRKEIASMANKVARSKTLLDGLGKELVSDWKTRSKVVDASRKKMRDELDKLKEEVRRPLSDWENAEIERISKHESFIRAIEMFLVDYGACNTSEQILPALTSLRVFEVTDSLEEFESRAIVALKKSEDYLKGLLEAAKQREAQKAELEKLKSEAEAREKREYEEKIARNAAEQAKKKAEQAARAEAEKKELLRLQAIKEKEEAEERARRAEQKAKEEKEQAEKDRIEAAEQAKKNEELAARRERDRIETERLKALEAEQARADDLKHRKTINNSVCDSLMSVAALDREKAEKIVVAIASGYVPNVRLRY